MNDSYYFNVGETIVRTMLRADRQTYQEKKAAWEEMNTNGHAFKSMLCKYAADAFQLIDGDHSPHRYVFQTLADNYPQGDELADLFSKSSSIGVYETIKDWDEKSADNWLDFNQHTEQLQKVSGLLGTVEDVGKMMLGAGALGGAALGGAGWYLNREATQDSTDLEKLQAKKLFYQNLTAQIKADLQRRNIDPATPEGVKSISDSAKRFTS